MDTKRIVEHAMATGFLRGAIDVKDGQPRIVGSTPWDEYRGDLEHRIGAPDLEGLQIWLAQEGLEYEPGCFGPLTLWHIFRDIGIADKTRSQVPVDPSKKELWDIIREVWEEMKAGK